MPGQGQVERFEVVAVAVGEFNLGDRQAFGVRLWDDNDISWTNWTFKVRQQVGSSSRIAKSALPQSSTTRWTSW